MPIEPGHHFHGTPEEFNDMWVSVFLFLRGTNLGGDSLCLEMIQLELQELIMQERVDGGQTTPPPSPRTAQQPRECPSVEKGGDRRRRAVLVTEKTPKTQSMYSATGVERDDMVKNSTQ